MLFGKNPLADVLLATLGWTTHDVPRFRDCYLDGETIVVHTRTGGGNRNSYEEENGRLTQHSCYVSDSDDDFDCTYANFIFRFPEEYAAELRAASAGAEVQAPSQKWEELLGALHNKKEAP